MRRERQTALLIGLLAFGIALAVLLNVWHPSVGGVPLREAELSPLHPMSKLLRTEQARLAGWLAVDCLFALVYTIFYTGALRVLASRTRSARLDLLGRSLSWITAVAILFDLTENAVLWTEARTAATDISPWLFALVKLKFLSAGVFIIYGAIWVVDRLRDRQDAR